MINIDTQIHLKWSDGEKDRTKEVTLPYQTNVFPRDNYDEEDQLVRFCFSTLDSKDIGTQFAEIRSILVRHDDCNMALFKEVSITSGIITTKMLNPVVTETWNDYARFITIEARIDECK